MVNCMSFGFKYGIPEEADLVFDVRCLPNPYYVEDLKYLTGLDDPVREYVMKWPETHGFVQHFLPLIDYMLPLYCNEGKKPTGGGHWMYGRKAPLRGIDPATVQPSAGKRKARQRASSGHSEIG